MRFRSDPAADPRLDRPGRDPVRREWRRRPRPLARLIEWQIESGSHGISVHGSTGEPSTQSVEERESVLEVAAATVADRVPFFPGPAARISRRRCD